MPAPAATAAIWLISIAVIALILFRPRRVPEYILATAGAALLVLAQLVPWPQALASVRQGTDVYLFLTGMMLLAELARLHGVFDWLAEHAMQQSRGSRLRLFSLVYAVGILVTSLLSNDATAVVLTPAVLAVVRRGRMSPLPCLFACAFIANAASFVLPISNPANLVVYGSHLPALAPWLRTFLLPSIVSIVATFALLYWYTRKDLAGSIPKDLASSLNDGIRPTSLSPKGRRAAFGILFAAAVLLLASAFNQPLGVATCAAAIVVLLAITTTDVREYRTILHDVSWGVLPLVAALFIMVGAMNHAGALAVTVAALQRCAAWPHAGPVAASFAIGIAANTINNLPVGLIGSAAVQAAHASPLMHAAVLLGIDLGPNLSVTGSLATILWLIALRREKIEVSGAQFLRAGIWIMPPALLLAVLSLVLWHH